MKCTKKLAWFEKSRAKKYARHSRLILRVYKCPSCSGEGLPVYHVTRGSAEDQRVLRSWSSAT